MSETFFITDEFYTHSVGDMGCEEGWCGCGSSFPKPCECGGLIHADFGDEYANGDYYLIKKCDKCGDDMRRTDD